MSIEFIPLDNDDRWLTKVQVLFGENDGFDGEGLDADGYNRDGYKADEDGVMRDRGGYDEDGYKPDKWGEDRDEAGYDRDGYDVNRRDSDGYDEEGYDIDGYDREGYNEAGYDEDGYDQDGYSRYDEDDDWLNSDEPDYVFRSTEQEKPDSAGHRIASETSPVDGIPYYGMEIELTSDNRSEVQDIITKDYKDYVWAKADCSVDGFEMVTHPMTRQWADEGFPWDIVAQLGRNGCHVMRESNGLHIHVSRSGFRNYAHLFSWVKFWYTNSDKIADVDGIAGRTAWEWGKFADRADQCVTLKYQMRSMGHKKEGARYRDDIPYIQRYRAINLQNTNTVEVRVFASTTSPEKLRMRFDFVAATVEYTRNLSVKEIRDGGWTWNKFADWVAIHGSEYPALARRLAPVTTLA